ncbi:hypothetical protein [Dictyobacter formicarum]|uniref:Pyridine nucleotide-disulphide oxidoreductase dimerisation domain-containing protein n=1 Tax=Dictyobacter formicarum TaxID=2778368 RepID=A0ABQ3V8U0_9CHLR|nr:hypothetical protein [Dictyobacter formicarum]GHO82547.1 hypothetical protein KSZ_05530 [Dictyobacter formicarum]
MGHNEDDPFCGEKVFYKYYPRFFCHFQVTPELVGVNDLVGAHAGELLGEMALVLQKRLTIGDILDTIHPYPTLTTGLQQIALEAYLTSARARTNLTIVQTALRFRTALPSRFGEIADRTIRRWGRR